MIDANLRKANIIELGVSSRTNKERSEPERTQHDQTITQIVRKRKRENEMKKGGKKVTFHDVVQVTTAINYSRKTKRNWLNLSTVDKIRIRLELNKFKMTEMTVHPQRK